MADDLLGLLGTSDLAAFNQSVQQSDPYGILGRQLGAWQPDMSTWSPTAVGATSFGKAFLSGLLGNYARQNAADQMNSVIGVLPQLRSNPMTVATPEGVSPDAFANLRASAVIKNEVGKAQESELQRKFNSDLLLRVLGKKADIMGEAQAYQDLGQGGMLPNSPAATVAAEIKKEEDSARNELLTPTKYPAIAKLNTTSTALAQLKNIKDINTASADIPFATLFIGGLDGSVVREGEYARVAGANPFLEKFKNQLEGALNGTSTLGVEIKQQMFKELQKTQKGLYAEALLQAAPRIETAKVRGADPKRVYPFDPNMSFEDDAAPVTPAPGQVGGLDQAALMTEAAQLKASGLSPAQIAATLRAKYGGSMGVPTTASGVPLG